MVVRVTKFHTNLEVDNSTIINFIPKDLEMKECHLPIWVMKMKNNIKKSVETWSLPPDIRKRLYIQAYLQEDYSHRIIAHRKEDNIREVLLIGCSIPCKK